jgi:CBS domain-containing protein
MKARDVMTNHVIAVRADTPVQDIARLLLEKQISAVPVLDAAGAPIGMVSEGDLLGREDSGRQERLNRWLAMMAEGEPLSAEFLSSVHERTARDVMSKPVVTVFEETELGEIARILQGSRIKRAPVVRNGKVVGIVSRADLLRALAGDRPPAQVPPISPWLLPREVPSPEADPPGDGTASGGPPPAADDGSPNLADFRRLVADHERRQQRHGQEERKAVAEARRRAVAELSGRRLSDESWRSLVHQARLAAESGQKEFLLLRFPSELCSDGGRAVNAPEPDWPATLRGEAAEVYQRWEQELAPQGFRLAARVVDFPDGMPGDIGIFLVWR